MPEFDVVGVGLNATDTLLIVPHFRPMPGRCRSRKRWSRRAGRWQRAGGVRAAGAAYQVHRHGRDDERGRIQLESLREAGIDIEHVQLRKNCANHRPTSSSTAARASAPCCGGATIACASTRNRFCRNRSACARLLHIDGHDTPAVERAAAIARSHGIPVSVDVDTSITDSTACLPHVITCWPAPNSPRPGRPERPLQGAGIDAARIRNEGGGHDAGAHGALARENGEFFYSPAFVVNCVDTTARATCSTERSAMLSCRKCDARCPGVFQRHGGAQFARPWARAEESAVWKRFTA